MLNVWRENDVLIVSPNVQRLDISLSVEFKNKMVDLINNGNTPIILDLSDVGFIDSSGLGSIVSILKLIGNDRDFVLCGLGSNIMSIFKMTRMDRVFRIYCTINEAMLSRSI